MTYLFKEPLKLLRSRICNRSLSAVGALTLVCSTPSPCFSFLVASTAARCDAKTMTLPRCPSEGILNLENSKNLNSTTSDVNKDLSSNGESLLPSAINLRDSKKWKCTVYQFDSCPFCRKVRACLDFLQIPYEVVETHPLSKKELKPITQYRKVPVLVIDGIADNINSRYLLEDSKRIIHALMAHEGKAILDAEKERKEAELIWIKWSDDVLVQLIVMNIYRSIKESAETFNYLLTHPSYSLFERYSAQISGTLVMWLVSKRRKAKYQVLDERKALYKALADFLDAKGSNRFHGGNVPNEADLNVYGILRSIQGFTCEKDVKENTQIAKWMDSMKEIAGESFALNVKSKER